MSKVTILTKPNRIVIASKGVQGPPGPEGPQGESGPGISDAPDDGGAYIRVNGQWVQLYAPLALSGDLPDGTVDEPYSATLTASGGRPPYTLGDVLLPPGLDATLVDATVTVAGAPTEEWEGEAHIDLSDSLGSPLRSVFDVGVGGGGAVFDPATVFGASDRGAFFDLSGSAGLFQSNAGTGAVSIHSPIGYASDGGPLVRPATQATAASKPVWSGVPRTLAADTAPALADWAAGAGWAVADGVATKTAGTASGLSTPTALEAGKAYMVFYTIARTAGTVTARLTGGTAVTGPARNAAGSYFDILVAEAGNDSLEFSADAAFAGGVRLVSIREVTSYTNMGARFDGANDFLQSAAVDMSNSDKGTLVVSCQFGQVVGAMIPAAFGNTPANAPGSFEVLANGPVSARLRGDTSTGSSRITAAESPITLNELAAVFVAEYDLSGVTTGEEVSLRSRGAALTQAPSGGPAGGGMLANLPITIGRGFAAFPMLGLVHRAFFINRKLSGSERASVEAWARRGMAYCAVLGDSTVARLDTTVSLPVAARVSSMVGGMVTGGADLSRSGDRISHQKTKWAALEGKGSLEAVFIQIGQNDIKSRVGSTVDPTTIQDVIADLQDLVDTVRADAPAGCKIYVSALTPSKAWLDAATAPAEAYSGWLAFNAAIAGEGPTPITGVDGRITAHVAPLNDGSGYLRPEFDYASDGVHEDNAARFIIAQAWRAQLESDRLV